MVSSNNLTGMTSRFLLLWICIVALSCSRPIEQTASNIDSLQADATYHFVSRWTNQQVPLQKLLDSLHLSVSSLRIVISKSEYQLAVYSDTILIKNYPVVFGPNPEDDKLRRGDGCTPEGVFKVKSKYAHKKWSKFIWIDYPNEDSWRKHKLAKEQKLIPAKADIGGNIGIHGVPKGGDYAIDYRQNWTLGCISLKNKDVDEIYPFIHSNIEIEIKK
jgi:murein L,D-transpeptidase YafK